MTVSTSDSTSERYPTYYDAKFARERKDMPPHWAIRPIGTPLRPSYLLVRVVPETETEMEGKGYE